MSQLSGLTTCMSNIIEGSFYRVEAPIYCKERSITEERTDSKGTYVSFESAPSSFYINDDAIYIYNLQQETTVS